MTARGKFALMLAGILLGISVCEQFSVAFWGDQDWELLVARMLLQGRRLYIDQFVVNPPLIFWLYTIPAAIAIHVSFFEDYQALVLLTLTAIAVTIGMCVRLIAAHPGFADSPQRRIWFLVLLAFLFVFRIAPSYFGDREHLFLVLTFPYFLRWLPSLSHARYSRRLHLLIGGLAGIGFSMKPHCVLILAGFQLVCLARKDRPPILSSPENRLIYFILASYLAAICLFTPDYLTTVLPMELLTYSAISAGPATLFDYTIIITLFLTFAMFRPRYTSPYRRDIYFLLWVSLLLLGYGLINSGWGYTYQPILTLLLFINGFVLWEFLYLRGQASVGRAWSFTAGAACCLLNFASKAGIVMLASYMVFTHHCLGDRTCHGYYMPYIKEVESTPAPHSFGMIGMNFASWTRVAKLADADWATRFPQLWMIPKFIISGPQFAAQHQWILYYVADALADDLNQREPQLVFVDKERIIYTIALRQPFDWLGVFNGYETFKNAWRHYAYERTIDNCASLPPVEEVVIAAHLGSAPKNIINCRFDVYRRTP